MQDGATPTYPTVNSLFYQKEIFWQSSGQQDWLSLAPKESGPKPF